MIQTADALTEINLPGLTLFKKGKVRNVYDLGENLLFVASDRVSAFDVILPNGIPQKGQILTEISVFWFEKIKSLMPTHFISDQVEDFPSETKPYWPILKGRSILVKKTQLVEVECVIRGYIAGSGWKEYQADGTVCGKALPKGLRLADPLPEPIFTPASKADEGHDENISIETMKDLVGSDLTDLLMQKSLEIYNFGKDFALERGIVLADTKFEFGILDDEVILIDEVLTPDSSRFWPQNEIVPGQSPPSFDKQIVRDYLETTDWDKKPPAPHLPEAVAQKARQRYLEVKNLLMG